MCTCVYICVSSFVFIYMYVLLLGHETQYTCDRRKFLGFSNCLSPCLKSLFFPVHCYIHQFNWPKSFCRFVCCFFSPSDDRKTRTEGMCSIRLPSQWICSLSHFQSQHNNLYLLSSNTTYLDVFGN